MGMNITRDILTVATIHGRKSWFPSAGLSSDEDAREQARLFCMI
jgi:hypothetical protein